MSPSKPCVKVRGSLISWFRRLKVYAVHLCVLSDLVIGIRKSKFGVHFSYDMHKSYLYL